MKQHTKSDLWGGAVVSGESPLLGLVQELVHLGQASRNLAAIVRSGRGAPDWGKADPSPRIDSGDLSVGEQQGERERWLEEESIEDCVGRGSQNRHF